MLFKKNMIPLCNNNSVTNQISAQLLNRTDWLLSAQQAYFLSDSCEVWNHLEQFDQRSQNISYQNRTFDSLVSN